MARPPRIQYPGALYHVTSRGNAQQLIFERRPDYETFLATLELVVARYRWRCHTYCLLGNHYHLLLETPDPNLAFGMRQLNGTYAQAFNRPRGRVGHVFQGRYGAVLGSRASAICSSSPGTSLSTLSAHGSAGDRRSGLGAVTGQ